MTALPREKLPRQPKLLIDLRESFRLRALLFQSRMPRHKIHAAKQSPQFALKPGLGGGIIHPRSFKAGRAKSRNGRFNSRSGLVFPAPPEPEAPGETAERRRAFQRIFDLPPEILTAPDPLAAILARNKHADGEADG